MKNLLHSIPQIEIHQTKMSSQEIKETSSLLSSSKSYNKEERVAFIMSRLCMNELYSDVTFLLCDHRLPAHRKILTDRSKGFDRLLSNKQPEFRLEVPLEAFKVILSYIYTFKLALSRLNVDTVIDVLSLVHRYELQNVEPAIAKHLEQNLAVPNFTIILDAAFRYGLKELTNKCLYFLYKNATDILNHKSFQMMRISLLEQMLKTEVLYVPEMDILQAVGNWSVHNPSEDINTLIRYIRLERFSVHDLLHVVRPTGLFEPDKILDVITKRF